MDGFCLEKDTGKVMGLGACRNPVWIHEYGVPQSCRRLFYYTLKPNPTIAFPIATGGGVYRFCVEIRGETVRSYSSKHLSDVLGKIAELVAGTRPEDVVVLLRGLFKGLIAHYHEELSILDQNIERSIDSLLKKGEIPVPVYRLYDRASRLHRGVHGVIYSLHRLERIYEELRDLRDEAIMLENMYSTSIDRITQAFTLYFTLISDRTNKIVTKLTIISAIFLPLSLIAGIYGMNFKYMPELQHPLAYPLTLLTMLLIAVGELIYFKRRKWI